MSPWRNNSVASRPLTTRKLPSSTGPGYSLRFCTGRVFLCSSKSTCRDHGGFMVWDHGAVKGPDASEAGHLFEDAGECTRRELIYNRVSLPILLAADVVAGDQKLFASLGDEYALCPRRVAGQMYRLDARSASPRMMSSRSRSATQRGAPVPSRSYARPCGCFLV